MLRDLLSFNALYEKYDVEFKALVGEITFGEDQAWEVTGLLKNCHIYAGSNDSEKYDRGSHAYRFVSGAKEGNIWGGRPSLHDHDKKCHLYNLNVVVLLGSYSWYMTYKYTCSIDREIFISPNTLM